MKSISEQLLSFTENELVDKDSIRRAVLSEAPQKQRKNIAWTKVLLPIAACLVLLCGTVLAIPSARAEVFSWFRGSGPKEYLAQSPEERTPVPVLDELIVPPVPTDAPQETLQEGPAPIVADLPLGSVTNNRVLSVCDEPIWQEIADQMSIELGETMFDGEKLYLSVTYNGLCALPETVRYVGGSATATRIPDEDLAEIFEDGKVPAVYYQENVSEWETHEGRYWLKLDNGVEIFLGVPELLSSSPDLNPAFSEMIDTLRTGGPRTDAEQDAISEAVTAWLNGKTLRGVVTCETDLGGYGFLDGTYIPIEDKRQYLLDQTDENGMLTAALLYKAGPFGAYLTAELGTVQFDMRAWERIERSYLSAGAASKPFGSQKVILTHAEWIETPYDETTFAAKNTEADLEGVTFTASNGAYIDGLGIHGVRVTVKLPEDWSDEDCEAFFENLHFLALIEGEYYSLELTRSNSYDDRTVSYLFRTARVPYDRIESFDTIRIVPYLYHLTEMRVGGEAVPLVPNEQLLEPDTDLNVGWNGVDAELTSGILTFTKQP